MKIKHVLCFALLSGVLVLSACSNTVDGFGRDMESAGRNIQGTVK